MNKRMMAALIMLAMFVMYGSIVNADTYGVIFSFVERVLVSSGTEYEVKVSYDADAGIPAGSQLKVREIEKGSVEYDKYLAKCQERVSGRITDAGFLDIEIQYQGQKVEPKNPVTVEIRRVSDGQAENASPVDELMLSDEAIGDEVILKQTAVVSKNLVDEVTVTTDTDVFEGMQNVGIIHFENNNTITPMDVEETDDVLVFKTNSFSIYAIIYTVDFSYNGYEISIKGGNSILLSSLGRILGVEDFDVSDVESVEFSNEELLAVERTEPGTLVTGTVVLNGEEIEISDVAQVGDWVLNSLQAFDTEETLTIELKSGKTISITVTDAQSDAIHINNTSVVQTVTNPAGTRIDLFNYYVNPTTKGATGRSQWPGFYNGESDPKFNWYDMNGNEVGNKEYGDGQDAEWKKTHILGNGYNIGINKNHIFKFSPAYEGTVTDGDAESRNHNGGALNSYTGDGDPKQGIVKDKLDHGYPMLSIDNSSLDYLFNYDNNVEGKDVYQRVNNLLYVDPDGYYTYDSWDFKATLNNDNKTFTVSDQTSTDSEVRGFWPFGEKVFWSGMHMSTQFSMPANGQVLNPNGEYKDMQFEFSGDDDTWLYVDGVLVGDGGGIHNRTEIDINFATGKVIVTGRKDPNHAGSETYEDTLYSIFKKAKGESSLVASEWKDVDGDGTLDTFADITYHTFDMFYLERGGGESNLYIHYNLVSTDDFTGHKAYKGFNESGRMNRDQFKFELIGLDGRYEYVSDGVDENGNPKYKLESASWSNSSQTLAAGKSAIMPTGGTSSGAGTVASPKEERGSISVNGQNVGAVFYTTGVTEDGNINFGMAEINAAEEAAYTAGHASVYKYIIREVVPSDAVNADNITWAAATDEQKKAGGFVKDHIVYDGTVYYMAAQITSWQQLGSDGNYYTKYGFRKKYYTDDTYTTALDDTQFVNFVNSKDDIEYGHYRFTKVDVEDQSIQGAEFTLYKEESCRTVVTDKHGNRMAVKSDANGVVSIMDMAVGTYYLKETKAPTGYALDEIVYKVTIEDETDTSKQSRMVVNSTNEPVTYVTNEKVGELTVRKIWVNEYENEVSGGRRTATIKLKRKHMVEHQSSSQHSVAVTMQAENNGLHSVEIEPVTVTGDNIIVKWDDEYQGNFNWWLTIGEKSYEGWISSNNEINSQDNFTIEQDGEFRVLTITGAQGDISLTVKHWQTWINSDASHWNNYTNPSITASGISTTYLPEDDDVFNDENHTQQLTATSWSHMWTLGGTENDYADFDFPKEDRNGRDFLYYVAEIDDRGNEIAIDGEGPDYTLIGYSANNESGVAGQGVIKVFNRVDTPTTISITIKKVNDANHPLNNAIFKLERLSGESWQNVTTVPEVDSDSQFTVPSAGLTLTGLEDGKYRLQEVSAPPGYVINTQYPVAFTVANGAITDRAGTMEGVSYLPSDNTFIVPNEPGVALPTTGGIGTASIYTMGTLLTILAGLLLMTKALRA